MAKAPRPWTVGKHTPLHQIDDNLWAVEDMLGMGIHRRMCIIRRTDGDLIFFHAVPVDEATIAQIRALGTPKYLVVGHHQHAVDAHAFQEKFSLKAYGPKTLQSELKKRFDVAGALSDMPADPTIECIETPGTKHHEVSIIVKSGGGQRVSILTTDVLQNNPDSTPFLFRMLGFTGGLKIVPMFRIFFMSDKVRLKQTLHNWAQMPGLKRVVPFHGAIIEDDAKGAIQKAALAL